ncbi:FCPA [Symbiodinium sp. KB8]|nr:FCPA [Symbiodinium sp. KB8]
MSTQAKVQPPLGFWDPMGFTDDGDLLSYRRRRSVEFKHGRIAMLATMGFMTPEIIGHWPGYISPSLQLKFDDVPNGLLALLVVPALGWAQILIYFGLIEYSAGFEDYRTGTPGDYGWKVLTSDDPEERRRKLNADLANGRLAMVAIMALLFQNGVAGTTGPEMWLPRL